MMRWGAEILAIWRMFHVEQCPKMGSAGPSRALLKRGHFARALFSTLCVVDGVLILRRLFLNGKPALVAGLWA